MDVPGPERRLAAVIAADMVGYSRLMEADETGKLARLKTPSDRAHRSGYREEPRPHHQDHRRWHAGRVPQRRRCGAVRCRDPAADGGTQRGRLAGAGEAIP